MSCIFHLNSCVSNSISHSHPNVIQSIKLPTFADAISRVTARPRPPVTQPALGTPLNTLTTLSSSPLWPSQCPGSRVRPAGRRTVLASPHLSIRPPCPRWRRPLSMEAKRPGGKSSTIWTLRTATVCPNLQDSCQNFSALHSPNSLKTNPRQKIGCSGSGGRGTAT